LIEGRKKKKERKKDRKLNEEIEVVSHTKGHGLLKKEKSCGE
jgi:hypothetical protein